ncbi:thiolase family protein [Thermodesulfobacteriota bacterium]
MNIHGKKIVLAHGLRTPWGHINKSLSRFSAAELATMSLREVLAQSAIDPALIDGVILGWVGQGTSAPNIARIASVTAGLPVTTLAYTLHVNCVAGMESVCSAIRHMLADEGELFIAGGTESMSNLPYVIRGVRQSSGFRTLNDLQKKWAQLQNDPNLKLGDARVESTFDPICNMLQSETAEALAQIHGISRQEQDDYALTSYRRALAAIEAGAYDSHVFPVHQGDELLLERDENPGLRRKFVERPDKIAKSPFLFSDSDTPFENFYIKNQRYLMGKTFDCEASQPTLTPFNSCPLTDGSAAVIVTTEERARHCGLESLAVVEGWGFAGVEPAHMGIGPVYAAQKALQATGHTFADMDLVELHEAFAAGCLAIFKVGRSEYGQGWQELFEAEKLNPCGGSLALGHPLGATGTRLLLNLAYALKQSPDKRIGLAAGCASGGIAGCMILSRYDG